MEISVRGTAKASLRPERATLHINAGFESGDKAAVMARTTQLVQQLTSTIDSMREASPSPTTWSAVLPITTRSWRPYSNKGQVPPMRYGATAQVKLKFQDFQALSWFVDAWGGIEGVTVQRVEWTLTEQARLDAEAEILGKAVADAQGRAELMAKAAGFGGVEFVELSDPGMLKGTSENVDFPVAAGAMRAYMGGDDGEGIDLAPEDVELTAVVHARFRAQ